MEDGSYIDGYFVATFDGTSIQMPANATAEEMRLGLETVGTGNLAVTRSGTHASQFVKDVNRVEKME